MLIAPTTAPTRVHTFVTGVSAPRCAASASLRSSSQGDVGLVTTAIVTTKHQSMKATETTLSSSFHLLSGFESCAGCDTFLVAPAYTMARRDVMPDSARAD